MLEHSKVREALAATLVGPPAARHTYSCSIFTARSRPFPVRLPPRLLSNDCRNLSLPYMAIDGKEAERECVGYRGLKIVNTDKIKAP